MINTKVMIAILLAIIILFGSWLFFWPLVECWYAWSWEPLLSTSHKLYSFILGAIIFFGGLLGGTKTIMMP